MPMPYVKLNTDYKFNLANNLRKLNHEAILRDTSGFATFASTLCKDSGQSPTAGVIARECLE